MIFIKICGITEVQDAREISETGVNALGFIFYPKSKRYITPENANKIIKELPPFITTVGVFVNEKKDDVVNILHKCPVDVLQFHGDESPEYCAQFNKRIIKAFRIKELSDLNSLSRYSMVSAYLLDTYSPGIIGGTGQVFNWEIAVEAKKTGRIILAGGLSPENVEEAIKVVTPYGIDVSSSIEGNKKGEKDHRKMKLFIERAKNTFQKLS